MSEKQDAVMNIERQLREIDDVKKQKLEILARQDNDVTEVIQWLRQNRNLFREQVYEPIILEVSKILHANDDISLTCGILDMPTLLKTVLVAI